ncbi:hypothetical protein PAECIP111891_05230 [Paenibacillus allorhizoplanae]|uniref:Helix-turn-helix domain-containing protein n=1 Tax=Paenibacillus allorhizoplanae TaxID=2905648 RepID=A0ABM9CSN3_9BACL|nr:helix-turn-helix domain-containing protein [Paenibacillus allorhizoplanae]CAH1221551.1 hypothetical protein PAECIP111891_05230 [Paenibacillus allorhizoplanae]
MKNYACALAIVFLGLCIIVGCYLCSISFKNKVITPTVITPTSNHQLLNRSELAHYLGISEIEVDKLGPQNIGAGQTQSLIPYVKIGNKIYYSVTAIDKWLESANGVIVQ